MGKHLEHWQSCYFIFRPIFPPAFTNQANSADGLPVADPDYGSSNPSTEQQTVSICVDGGGRGRNRYRMGKKSVGLETVYPNMVHYDDHPMVLNDVE